MGFFERWFGTPDNSKVELHKLKEKLSFEKNEELVRAQLPSILKKELEERLSFKRQFNPKDWEQIEYVERLAFRLQPHMSLGNNCFLERVWCEDCGQVIDVVIDVGRASNIEIMKTAQELHPNCIKLVPLSKVAKLCMKLIFQEFNEKGEKNL